MLHALPVLSALRARFPEARIDWAVEDRAVDLLRHRPDLDRVLSFPRSRLSGALRGIPRPLDLLRTAKGFVHEMRAGDYDVALDLQGNLKSGAVTRASGAGLRFGLGGRDAREGNQLFTQRRAQPASESDHRVERNLAVAGALLGERLPYCPPGFPVPDAVSEQAKEHLALAGASPGDYVLLHPGTSGFGSFKRWPAERFGSLARRLATDGRQVLVTYGPGEEDLAARVVASSGGGATALATEGLPVLAEVIRRAALFVAGDTGPLHLASLVGTPLLGLFGPKDPQVYGPYGIAPDASQPSRTGRGETGPGADDRVPDAAPETRRRHGDGGNAHGRPRLLDVLTQDDVACRPCALRKCGAPLCMTTLAPERVYEAVCGILARLPASTPGVTPGVTPGEPRPETDD